MTITMIEPVLIADIFCERAGKVELINDGVARVTLYVTQMYLGEAEHVIVLRMIMPVESVPKEWLEMAAPTLVFDGVPCESTARH